MENRNSEKMEFSYEEMLKIVYTLYTEELSKKQETNRQKILSIFKEGIDKEKSSIKYFMNNKNIENDICLELIIENSLYLKEEETLKIKSQNILLKLQMLSKTEIIETQKLFQYMFSKEYSNKKDFIKKQLKDTGKLIFLGAFQLIPFSGLITPVLVKAFEKIGINILPSSFKDMKEIQNKIINWINDCEILEAEKKCILPNQSKAEIEEKFSIFKPKEIIKKVSNQINKKFTKKEM